MKQQPLATEQEFAEARTHAYKWKSKLLRWLQSLPGAATLRYNPQQPVYVGRYDEDRIGLYESDLFLVNNNNATRRTVHVGI